MALLLTEKDVKGILTMDIALRAVEEGFRHLAEGNAANSPRSHTRFPNGALATMSAAIPELGAIGLKTYCLLDGKPAQFYVYLYDVSTGDLMALIEASEMGRMRTGAASGVATKYLAREDASTAGVIGAGYQAPTQIEAVSSVRNIKTFKIFNRTRFRARALAEYTVSKLGIEAQAVDSAEECVSGSDIVITITSSVEPVLLGKWLSPGTHINAAGSNHHERRELDQEAVRRADIVVTDDIEQAKAECGDLIQSAEAGVFVWQHVGKLSDQISGRSPRRSSKADVTLFESQGIALTDVAVGAKLYGLAKGAGAGTNLAGHLRSAPKTPHGGYTP